jgi:hypothetical protein
LGKYKKHGNNERTRIMKKNYLRLVVVLIAVIAVLFAGSCATCERCAKDWDSEINNGMERIIRVYDYEGDLIAEYEGHIDIEDNSGTYCLFHIDGKRYIYYNAIVEIIEK